MTDVQVRLPEIVTKGIYDGKFCDRNPELRSVSLFWLQQYCVASAHILKAFCCVFVPFTLEIVLS